MTAHIGSLATGLVVQRLTAAATGVNANLSSLMNGIPGLAPLDPAQIRTGNIASEIADHSNTVRYPTANVYCEKIVNTQVEKFRTFSGFILMTIDLRYSSDRVDHVQSTLEIYTDAVMGVLDVCSGDWGSGLFYGGGFTVVFGPVKQGGKNFIQTAKITFEIGVSIS
jgi:hypothetical protein